MYKVLLHNSRAKVQDLTPWVAQDTRPVFRTCDEAIRAGSPIPAYFTAKGEAEAYAQQLNADLPQEEG